MTGRPKGLEGSMEVGGDFLPVSRVQTLLSVLPPAAGYRATPLRRSPPTRGKRQKYLKKPDTTLNCTSSPGTAPGVSQDMKKKPRAAVSVRRLNLMSIRWAEPKLDVVKPEGFRGSSGKAALA